MNISVKIGVKCARCDTRVGVMSVIGKEKLCKCECPLIPDEEAEVRANVRCQNCDVIFGMISGIGSCPVCKYPF